MSRSRWLDSRRCPQRALASLAALAFGVGACSTFPTQGEIESSLDAQLASVTGDWTGAAIPDPALTLRFHLAEAADGQVTGTGSMQERGATAPAPLSITGSYRRPDLALAFDGMIVAGHVVHGTFHGRYTTVGGVGDTLVLTGVNGDAYTQRVSVLLQETGS